MSSPEFPLFGELLLFELVKMASFGVIRLLILIIGSCSNFGKTIGNLNLVVKVFMLQMEKIAFLLM